MAATAETETIIVGMEIVLAAIEIGVVDMAETVTMIVGTMIAEVATVLVIEIGDVTMMTVNVSEVHGVTVEMQEAISIETRGSQVRD